MNQLIVISCLSALLVGLTLISASKLDTYHSEWKEFKAKHKKHFDCKLVEQVRKGIYFENKEYIEEFNRKHSERRGFKLKINHLSDRTNDELKLLNGLKVKNLTNYLGSFENDDFETKKSKEFLNKILNDKSIPVPDSLDWRTVPNRVSGVKNQGYCGSCWSFATTGVLEGQEITRKGIKNLEKLIPLSEQILLDCMNLGHDACEGGDMYQALKFVSKIGGLGDEYSYPYYAKQYKCRPEKNKPIFTDSGAAILEGNDEEKLKQLVAKYGPVSVGIVADNHDFKFYESGIYKHENCGSQLDHAVLIVGYGTDEDGVDYWIVKNSWSEKWGEKGYVRMIRNSKNNCGIAMLPTIATF